MAGLRGLAQSTCTRFLKYLVKDVRNYQQLQPLNELFTVALDTLLLKLVLQLVSAFPVIASLANQYRNFVIAYLHLVLLGFISVFAFAMIMRWYNLSRDRCVMLGMMFFFSSFCVTEALLVLQAMGAIWRFSIPEYPLVLLFSSLGFPVGVLFVGYALQCVIKRKSMAVAASN